MKTTIFVVNEYFNDVNTQIAFTNKEGAKKYVKERQKFFDEIDMLYREHDSLSFVLPVLSIIEMPLHGIEIIRKAAIEDYLNCRKMWEDYLASNIEDDEFVDNLNNDLDELLNNKNS